jgi:ATP-dependent RNA helicase RhlE
VDEHHLLADIEKLIEQRLPKEVVAGFGVNPDIKAEPIPNGRKAPSGGGGGQRTRRSAPKSASQKSSRQPSSRTAAGDKKSGASSPTPRRSGKRR